MLCQDCPDREQCTQVCSKVEEYFRTLGIRSSNWSGVKIIYTEKMEVTDGVDSYKT